MLEQHLLFQPRNGISSLYRNDICSSHIGTVLAVLARTTVAFSRNGIPKNDIVPRNDIVPMSDSPSIYSIDSLEDKDSNKPYGSKYLGQIVLQKLCSYVVLNSNCFWAVLKAHKVVIRKGPQHQPLPSAKIHYIMLLFINIYYLLLLKPDCNLRCNDWSRNCNCWFGAVSNHPCLYQWWIQHPNHGLCWLVEG